MSSTQRPSPGDDYFMNREGLWLFTQKWIPTKPKAVVFIIHGMSEHCIRYAKFASHLRDQGFAVFALDHQGHGKSEGERLHVEDFQRYVDDVMSFVEHVTKKNADLANLPKFLCGHSMGGLITIMTAMESKKVGVSWTGVIMSGPALKPDPKTANPVNLFLASVLSKIAPKFAMPWEKGPAVKYAMSHDADVVAEYKADPLVYHGGLRILFAHTIVQYMTRTLAAADKFDTPYLLLHGSEDKACLHQGSVEWHSRTASKDKTFITVDGGYHELLMETDEYKKPTWANVVRFITERI